MSWQHIYLYKIYKVYYLYFTHMSPSVPDFWATDWGIEAKRQTALSYLKGDIISVTNPLFFNVERLRMCGESLQCGNISEAEARGAIREGCILQARHALTLAQHPEEGLIQKVKKQVSKLLWEGAPPKKGALFPADEIWPNRQYLAFWIRERIFSPEEIARIYFDDGDEAGAYRWETYVKISLGEGDLVEEHLRVLQNYWYHVGEMTRRAALWNEEPLDYHYI